MTQCKEGSQREGLMLDSAEELYKWFTQQVRGAHRPPESCTGYGTVEEEQGSPSECMCACFRTLYTVTN